MWPMRSRTAKKSSTGLKRSSRSPNCAALQHLGFKHDCAGGRGKNEALADGDLSARPDEGAPEIFADVEVRFVVSQVPESGPEAGLCGMRLGEHHFDLPGRLLALAAQRAARIEARGNHAAVVEDQQVAGIEAARETRQSSRRARRRWRDPSPACGSGRARRAAAAQSTPRADRNRNRQRAEPLICLLRGFAAFLK